MFLKYNPFLAPETDSMEENTSIAVRQGQQVMKIEKSWKKKKDFLEMLERRMGSQFNFRGNRKRRGQFQDILEQLQVYLSSAQKEEIENLKTLFSTLEYPQIVKSIPLQDAFKSKGTVFIEDHKQYMQGKNDLELTLISPYNIVC